MDQQTDRQTNYHTFLCAPRHNNHFSIRGDYKVIINTLFPILLCLGYPQSDGGSTVTSYTIECKHTSSAASNDSWHAVATVADPQTFSGHSSTSPPPSLSHTVTQLLPGEEYVFRVHCQNGIGVRAV